MARINLLPWREQERKKRQRDFGVLVFLCVLMTAAGLAGWHFYNEELVAHQKDRNKFMQSQIAELEEQIKEIEELEETRQRLVDRMNVIQNLQSSRPQIVHLFDEIVETLPTGAYLTQLAQKGNTVSLSGFAESNARVSSLMRNIESSAWIGNARLKVIAARAENESGLSQFSLSIAQKTPQAESDQ